MLRRLAQAKSSLHRKFVPHGLEHLVMGCPDKNISDHALGSFSRCALTLLRSHERGGDCINQANEAGKNTQHLTFRLTLKTDDKKAAKWVRASLEHFFLLRRALRVTCAPVWSSSLS